MNPSISSRQCKIYYTVILPVSKAKYTETIHLLFPGGGGGTPLQVANRDVPLDGVAFSIDLLQWGHQFSDFWGK